MNTALGFLPCFFIRRRALRPLRPASAISVNTPSQISVIGRAIRLILVHIGVVLSQLLVVLWVIATAPDSREVETGLGPAPLSTLSATRVPLTAPTRVTPCSRAPFTVLPLMSTVESRT